MQAVKGIYKNGKIELMESLGNIESADLFIVVIPHPNEKPNVACSHEMYRKRQITSEEEFKQAGLIGFFDTDDDANVDWEDVFGIKNR